MEEYAPEATTFYAALTAVSFAVAFAIIFSVILAAVESGFKKYFQSLFAIFVRLSLFGGPVSIVAYVSGLLTGTSRTGAVANVIPAAMALVGGLTIYVFGSDNKYKILIGYCVSLFAIMLLYGVEYGAFRREADRESRFEELARQELQIRTVRENLGLPKDIPSWIISSEPK